MKSRKARSRKQKLPPDPRRLFAQPEQNFYRMPELELRAHSVLTDGCRRLLDFTSERVSLDTGSFIVTLYGTSLHIESYAGKRLILGGHFSRIELKNKWEVPADES